MVLRKPARFENLVSNFSKMSPVIYSRKTGKYLNQDFFYRKLTKNCLDSFSALLLVFFRYWPSLGGKEGSKLDQKCQLWVRPFSINKRILPKNFQTVFFFVRVLPLLRISAILDYIREIRAQKPTKKIYFVDAESVGKTLEICNLPTTNETDETYHNYASSWECKPNSS